MNLRCLALLLWSVHLISGPERTAAEAFLCLRFHTMHRFREVLRTMSFSSLFFQVWDSVGRGRLGDERACRSAHHSRTPLLKAAVCQVCSAVPEQRSGDVRAVADVVNVQGAAGVLSFLLGKLGFSQNEGKGDKGRDDQRDHDRRHLSKPQGGPEFGPCGPSASQPPSKG
uniref:Uncharacterized protein n=1 Tax=Rhipicephalus appendiculatus TaxID=34631 RepID=A0A131YBZ3_RHIAP